LDEKGFATFSNHEGNIIIQMRGEKITVIDMNLDSFALMLCHEMGMLLVPRLKALAQT